MKKYNEPDFKVTACSVDEDILTTSNYTDLFDSTDYEGGDFFSQGSGATAGV